MFVAAKVRDVVEEAPACGIAIYKGGCQLSGRTVGFRRKKDWEPVHEASLGRGVRVDSLVDPARNQRFRHGEFAEVGNFLGFGFEIFQAGMGQNEVQNQQPGLDQFTRKAAAIAQVIAVESAVDFAREEVEDRCPVSASGSPNVAQSDTLAGELVHVPALRGARVIKKLAQSEVARSAWRRGRENGIPARCNRDQ